MADKKVDVGVRLKLEQTDAAVSEVEKLRKRVLELEGATKKADTGFMDLAKQAAAMALAVNIAPAIHQVADFAKSLVMTSVEGDAADTALAGLISTVQGIPWDDAKSDAGRLGDEFDVLAAKAGVAGDDMAAGFQAMLEMVGATEEGVEQAVDDVQQLSVVAGVLGKSVEGLSREFSFMEEGVLKTKGQLFQLLQTTGIFGIETKKAAEHWSKMTEESRIKSLNYGLSQIAGSMAKAEPSAKQLLTSIEGLYEASKERLGDPLLHELIPVLTEVRDRMIAALPAIEKFAKTIGPEVAHWVSSAVQKIEDGFKYLRDHSMEIHDAIVSAYEKAKAVVDWIISNRDLIAVAFGAKTAIPMIGGVIGAGKSAISGAGAVAGALGIGGAAAGVAAFAAAVAVFAGAVYAVTKFTELSERRTEDQLAMVKQLGEVAEGGNVALVENLSANLRSVAEVVNGELDPALDETLRHIHSIAEASQRMKDADLSSIQREIDLAVSKMKDLPEVAAAVAGAQGQQKAQQYSETVIANQAALLIDAYNEATRVGSTAMASMAAQTIAGSDALKKAFLQSSEAVEGGLMKFSDVVLAGGSQFAGFTAAIRGKESAKVPGAPVVHMSGGQTFKITQDFRDVDPDRIALVFERDIVKLAENRLQARTTIPFGG